MPRNDTVQVFSFRVFDLQAGEMRLARFKAPRDVIRENFRGDVLEGTSQAVPRAELDDQGRYRRIATAWGALE